MVRVRGEDVDRIRHYFYLEQSNWFAQYLPFVAAAEGISSELTSKFDHTGGLLDTSEVRSDPETAFGVEEVNSSEGHADVTEGLKGRQVQCSFLVGVLLNIGARYGIEVRPLIRFALDLIPDRKSNQQWLQGEGYAQEAEKAARICHTMNAGKQRSTLHTSGGSLSWKCLGQQVLGCKGAGFLPLESFRPAADRLSYALEACGHLVGLGGLVLRAEIEAEAERRIKGCMTFRGCDGTYDVLSNRQWKSAV